MQSMNNYSPHPDYYGSYADKRNHGNNYQHHMDDSYEQSDYSKGQTGGAMLLQPPNLLTPDPSPIFVGRRSSYDESDEATRRRGLLRANTMMDPNAAEEAPQFEYRDSHSDEPPSLDQIYKKWRRSSFLRDIDDKTLIIGACLILLGIPSLIVIFSSIKQARPRDQRIEKLPEFGPQFFPSRSARLPSALEDNVDNSNTDQVDKQRAVPPEPAAERSGFESIRASGERRRLEKEQQQQPPVVDTPSISSPPSSAVQINPQHLLMACEIGDLSTLRAILGNPAKQDGRQMLLDDKLWTDDASNTAGDRPLHRAARFGKLALVKVLVEEYQAPVDQRNLQSDYAIHVASFEGHWPVVEYMIGLQLPTPLIEARGTCNQTPLQRAASSGKLAIVQLLAKKGAKLNARSMCVDEQSQELDKERDPQQGDLAIHLAAEWGNAGVVAFLLDANRDLMLEARNHHGRTPLLEAAYHGHLPIVELCVSRGANILAQDTDEDSTAVHLATKGSHLSIVKYLAELKQELVEARDAAGMTPLLLSSKIGHLRILQYLMKTKGANLRAKNNDGEEAVHLAAAAGNVNLVAFLMGLQPGFIDARTNSGDLALHVAAFNGHLSVVTSLVATRRAHVSATDDLGRTPLLAAAAGGHVHVLRYLVEKGEADVMARSDDDGEDAGATVLHLACKSGCAECLPYLLALKPDLANVQDSKGDLPVHLAVQSENLATLELLIVSQRASIESIGSHGRTPLLAAIEAGNAKAVELLSKKGANLYAMVTLEDNKQLFPVHLAAQLGHLDIVKKLVERHPEMIDTNMGNGDTPIHIAALAGHVEIVKFILDKKPEAIESLGFIGRTPLQHAAAAGHLDIVNLLLQRGANAMAQDNEFESTALHLASRFGHLDCVKSLLAAAPELLNTANKIKDLPIHRAVYGGQLEVLRYLVGEKRADLEVKGELGRTPLLLACTRGSLEVVNYLIERGADLFAKDYEHEVSAIHLAAYFNHDKILSRLIQAAPGLLKATDQHGHTPLEMAKQKNVEKIVAILEAATAGNY